MQLAFVIDPLATLDPSHDTSVALMEAAQAAGHGVWVTTADHLSVAGTQAWARLWPTELTPVSLADGHWEAAERWYATGESTLSSLQAMDAVLMRTDPPVTVPYLYATQILDRLDRQRTPVVNAPRGLQAANEKLYALQFGELIPETLVTQDRALVRQFVEQHGEAVLKPLDGKGGEGILVLQAGDRNFNSLLELATKQGREPIVIQTYLAAASEGDKRIILLDGEPIGALNRIPQGDEFRGNMAVGGRVARASITERDRAICAQLAPRLRADGLYLAGIDIIGGYLTEVNVTSPTGVREIDRLEGSRLGKQVVRWLEAWQQSRQ